MWSSIIDRVLARPLVAVLLAGGLLLAVAAPAVQIHTAQPSIDSFPQSLLTTYNRLKVAFPGTEISANVVVKAPDVGTAEVQQAIGDLTTAAVDTAGMNEPVTVDVNTDGTVAVISIPVDGDGTDATSNQALADLREEIIPSTVGTLDDTEVAVTGITAQSKDFNDQMKTVAPLVFGFVLLLAFGLMLLSFRSVVIAAQAVVLNLLSVGAAYGVLVLVFQHGWGKELLGFEFTGGIDPFLPILLFVILFGLSMDYHVFILSRIREAHDKGMSTDHAIAHGIKSTAGVVTSAAIVMVGVFAIFATLQAMIFKQFGVGLAVAILIDATIVRAILLPASMKLLGEWNWYLPRWLAWMPHLEPDVTVDGESAGRRGCSIRGRSPAAGRPRGRGRPVVTTALRRFFVVVVPLALAVLLWYHPDGGPDIFADIHNDVAPWMVVHTAMLFGFPLLVFSTLLLLTGIQSRAATVSRVALVPFLAFYTAWETTIGIGNGVLVDYANDLPPDEQAVVSDAIQHYSLQLDHRRRVRRHLHRRTWLGGRDGCCVHRAQACRRRVDRLHPDLALLRVRAAPATDRPGRARLLRRGCRAGGEVAEADARTRRPSPSRGTCRPRLPPRETRRAAVVPPRVRRHRAARGRRQRPSAAARYVGRRSRPEHSGPAGHPPRRRLGLQPPAAGRMAWTAGHLGRLPRRGLRLDRGGLLHGAGRARPETTSPASPRAPRDCCSSPVARSSCGGPADETTGVRGGTPGDC